MARRHLIGLLLAAENDWPTAFDSVLRRLGPIRYRGETHEFPTERIVNEPFDLRYKPDYTLVIDRLAWWYHVPREWLKKIALMDDVYLLNNPFTFQAMEKHSAYCAMMRLGLRVPETWLIPHRVPPDNPRFAPMAERYYAPFDLGAIAEGIGYPLFMKPFDGGAWIGVARVDSPGDLQRTYDESGERLMHVQSAVEDYDVFTRSLSIGPQTAVMHYDPTQEHHDRYVFEHDFTTPQLEEELVSLSRLVNAFFRWEFNSCEVIIKDGRTFPIDYANASPDIALTSLHYHFPWAIKSLVAWSIFCLLKGRSMRINQNIREYFRIGDRDDLSYDEKLERYRQLADAYFDVEEFEEFSATTLAHLDHVMTEYVESTDFDDLLVDVVHTTEPPHMQEHLIERCRVRTRAWVEDQAAAAR